MNKTVKHPCQGCIYFAACGESSRTHLCEGRTTKREAKKALTNAANIGQGSSSQ